MSEPRWLGLALVIGGALLLSLKGIVAKFLYAAGMTYDTVTGIRAVLALPGFWLWGLWRLGARRLLGVDRRALLAAAFAGFLCYYLGAMVDFYALTLIDAGLERVILFSYPALVVLVRTLQAGRLPGQRVLLALLGTYTGVFLVVGGFNPALLADNLYGTALVLVCACTLAYYFIANERISGLIGSVAFTVYAMTASAGGLAAHLAIVCEPAQFALSARAWQLMAFMVIAVTILPLFMMAEGVRLIGAQRAAMVTTVGPAATIVFAWWLLDERMLPLQLLGAGLIVAAIVFLERRPATPKVDLPEAGAGRAQPQGEES